MIIELMTFTPEHTHHIDITSSDGLFWVSVVPIMESIVPIVDSNDFVLVRTHGLIVHHPDDIALLHPNRLVVSVVVPLDVAPEPLLQPLQQAFLYSHEQSVRDLRTNTISQKRHRNCKQLEDCKGDLPPRIGCAR